ncbi:protein of unknown function [Saccharopolyspora antimicrobica]|uniref:Uncharacterized protein DUF397 n=1 Tax=Saccharopolyspora antimicrobica TaxID=455193 RepID=A0A1I5K8X8_9PSEU|nr:DUF397 domain-containing protein [Saccharopolyspora antimicrobica]RKT81907.1 uncharacterized protein DUF397 [Saccharopolyspora antimicrobica]SFO81534.1 protein of unknown function [Saccharopolyspora antimicrobica]
MSAPELSTATWLKSSYSQGNGGQCVEVAVQPTVVGVRDSKDPDGPVLVFNPSAFAQFLGTLRS